MEKLYQYSNKRIDSVGLDFKRYLWSKIDWRNRLIAITGARGVGKTTLILQYIKETFSLNRNEVLYVSLDDLYFSRNTLIDFADEFVKRGGKYLFLDEVHKYKNWSQELKNIYDYFSDLKLVVTGSSALNLFKGNADLSRRILLYRMHGLSFREFIALKYKKEFPALSLEDVLHQPAMYISPILGKIKPIKLFGEYLKFGYYPFFLEDEDNFHTRLKQTVNQVLETDLPSVERIDYNAIYSLRRLVAIISEIVPYKPNIVKLSNQVGVSRETLVKYLYLLSKADLLLLLQSDINGMSRMNKPEKVYLENPNLIYALSGKMMSSGTIRETFFFNQLSEGYNVKYSPKADFVVDKKYTIEVGGKNKTRKQIQGIENAFIAMDNIEYSFGNNIPLWLFGFLY